MQKIIDEKAYGEKLLKASEQALAAMRGRPLCLPLKPSDLDRLKPIAIECGLVPLRTVLTTVVGFQDPELNDAERQSLVANAIKVHNSLV